MRDCWMKYIRDLETIPAFSPAERGLAQAMVWNRVAMLYLRRSGGARESGFDVRCAIAHDCLTRGTSPSSNELKQQAVQCLERSLALAPLHLPTYRLLIDVQKYWKNKAGVEAAARRLLEKFPDDLETLQLLLDSAFEQGRLRRRRWSTLGGSVP